MERLGIQNLQQALEGRTERDLDESLNRHLRRLEAASEISSDGSSPTPPETRKEDRQEPLSDLFLALCESVAQTYLERDRPDSAMKVVWEAFVSRPRLAEYRALREWSLKAGSWPAWRKKAWEHIHGAEGQAGEAVGILLWEGHLEEAWKEARLRGASDAEWLELARRREQDYPQEAVEIYRIRIDQLLPKAGASGYREAVKWLRRMESLQVQLGQEQEFADFLQSLRERHRRRPRWLQFLDEGFGPERG